MSAPPRNEHVDLALELADRARAVLRARFRTPVDEELKDDATPVTAVDREVEELLRERIRRAFPGHGILGEEHGAEGLDAEHVWVLDPIDGTKAFASGKPLFGSLIALVERGRPTVGVIECPATEERWLGVDPSPGSGGSVAAGAWHDGAPCRVRAPRGLADAVLYTIPLDLPGYRALRDGTRWTVHDADCYAYGLLASGTVDVVVESGLAPYDCCALAPVVRGAGGTIREWSGRGVGLVSDGTLVAASTPELATEALRTLGVPE